MIAARDLPDGARSILSAASELFALEGFESVSVGAIAERAGVSKANVFHHFASKEALLLAVMRGISDAHVQFAESLLDQAGSCAEKLRTLIAFELTYMFEHRQNMQLVLREIDDRSRRAACAHATRVFHRNFRAVVALFEQGRSRGELRRDLDPVAAAIMLGGASRFFFQSYEILRSVAKTRSVKNIQTFATQIANMLLDGIVATPDTPAAAKVGARRARGNTKACQ
jgi:TetR/AcrR family transcriptional regulator